MYQQIIDLIKSRLSCGKHCQSTNTPTNESQTVRAVAYFSNLSRCLKASLKCCGSVTVTILPDSEFKYSIVLGENENYWGAKCDAELAEIGFRRTKLDDLYRLCKLLLHIHDIVSHRFVHLIFNGSKFNLSVVKLFWAWMIPGSIRIYACQIRLQWDGRVEKGGVQTDRQTDTHTHTKRHCRFI